MKIVLDAMGSDTCPEPELAAAIEASRSFGDPIILVGPIEMLKPRLAALGAADGEVQLVDASETISMADKGMALALKAKRRNSKTSMAVGIDLVKNGEADAFLTAGNTGGAMTTAYFRLETIPGVERPALAATFPVRNGFCIVLDIGANPDCKPENLLQFAIMGSVYAKLVRGIDAPTLRRWSRRPAPTTSGTSTWTDRSYDMADIPVTDLVRDSATGDLYASNDFGVLMLPAGTTSWVLAAPGMPNVEVAGLTVVPSERRLYAATHGLSAWLLNLP